MSRIIIRIGDEKCFIERNDRGEVQIRRHDQPLVQRDDAIMVYPFESAHGEKTPPVWVSVEDE